MNAIDQIDQIKSEARESMLAKRENMIREIVKKGARKISFATAMHAISEKRGEQAFVTHSLDNTIDIAMQDDSEFFNPLNAELFG